MREVLESGSLLLDAAMGTALQSLGLRGPAPAWNVSHPERVRAVHLAHVAAGAECVLTNTFAGALSFRDSQSGVHPHRFYRAYAP